MFIKKIIKLFVPPIILKVIHDIRFSVKKTGWFAGFDSFEAAKKISTGYDSDIILQKCSTSLQKVKSGEVVYERDSYLFDEVQYYYPLLSSLLWVASQNNNTLSIIDFGGSLGSSYYQNRFFLSHLKKLEWNIVEQEQFVTEGKKIFEDEILKFYYSIDEVLAERKADMIIFSSVIQYIEKPFELLNKVINYNFKYILFDMTGVIKGENDIVTRQIVPEYIYKADYPCWFFSESKFINFFSSHYDLIFNFFGYFNNRIEIHNSKTIAQYKGFLFRLKQEN
ncbi:MAG: hypothetical protein A2015_03205 [Spirochaetes bacterium GWF1_31_7]|nr:MAG: hypothetical protein A2Y30_16665 [Spirochaetes bacterium GWE1_32_154]OHD50975.1 MAG: hypothetical protein A2015_03205 [Spirochaetes bacterium GWF1_31_7]HBD94145.1 methyltransferase, TIGR04325 family [Spirochaetia bacterium]HBI37250.1 methyltransferase, TIGR04325 family [Spirochaetia bacterium]